MIKLSNGDCVFVNNIALLKKRDVNGRKEVHLILNNGDMLVEQFRTEKEREAFISKLSPKT